MSEFSYETEMPVRFRDIDAIGHVNNAVYATYLEQARIEYIEDVLETSVAESGVVLAHLELDYERSIELDDAVTVALRVPELGRSSVPMEYEVRADGTVAATASTVMVAVDPDGDGSRPLPEAWRRRIEAHEDIDGT